MTMKNAIELTRAGQSAPYKDSVYAGTVTATSEAEARAKLAEMRHCETILDKQDKGDRWSSPYFTKFAEIETGRWEFIIVEKFTG